MKQFILILSLASIIGISRAQEVVIDRYPTSTIYALDYQTNHEVVVSNDGAILFKNAFIALVEKTNAARQFNVRTIPGRKTFLIKQVNPKIAYGYQLTLQNTFSGQTTAVYSFLYNIDQNTLSYYDQQIHNWREVPIEQDNAANLDKCQLYAKFNDQNQGVPDLSVNGGSQQAADFGVDADDIDIDAAVTAETAPPPLPDYEQPECPGDGYMWQPGYWAYSVAAHDYYWVPGVWIAPPAPEVLWTPPYWAYENTMFVFHPGYWGPTVGFYGGINYGCGYTGTGFIGGGWRSGVFRYNTAIVRVNPRRVHNVYVDRTVVVRQPMFNHISFNGRGGISAKPTTVEIEAMHQQHMRPTIEQIHNIQSARYDRTQFVSANNGRPTAIARERAPVVVPRPTRPDNSNTHADRGNFNNNSRFNNNGGMNNNIPAGNVPNDNFNNRHNTYSNPNNNNNSAAPVNNNAVNSQNPAPAPVRNNFGRPGTNVNGNNTVTNPNTQPSNDSKPAHNWGNYYRPGNAPNQGGNQPAVSNHQPAPTAPAPAPVQRSAPPARTMQAPVQRSEQPVQRPSRPNNDPKRSQ